MREFENLQSYLHTTLTPSEVAQVLRAIVSEPEPWEWFTRARIPFPFAVEILRALRDGDYLAFEPTRLTPRGEALAHELNVHPAPDLKCPTCAGRAVLRPRACSRTMDSSRENCAICISMF